MQASLKQQQARRTLSVLLVNPQSCPCSRSSPALCSLHAAATYLTDSEPSYGKSGASTHQQTLFAERQSTPRYRFSPPPHPTTSRRRRNKPHALCTAVWQFHRRYGAGAVNCEASCTWFADAMNERAHRPELSTRSDSCSSCSSDGSWVVPETGGSGRLARTTSPVKALPAHPTHYAAFHLSIRSPTHRVPYFIRYFESL